LFEKFNGKIIWSADGISLEELIRTIEGDFPKGFVAIKLDRLFLTKYGLSAISEIQKRGVPVFADAKIIEIPSKVDEITKLHLEHQPWMLNVMAGACNTGLWRGDPNADELYQFAGLCRGAGTKPCAVTVLTSKTENLVRQEFNKSVFDAVVFYVELAVGCSITDIVCSPNEAKYVRSIRAIDINTPGIRLPGSDPKDQARIDTPNNALKSGATRLIIGRDLSRGGKFTENFAKIMANIEGGGSDVC
jgi:orotidine-5'-phosphate decarboxylase